MINALTGFVQKKQCSRLFQKPNFVKPNSIKNISDEIIIKNKPVFKNAGLFFTSESLKNHLLSTDLDKITVSANPNNQITIPQSPLLEKSLNSFLETFPNFIEIFKHPQRDVDGLGTHTLKTLKEVLKNDDYKKLNDKNKNIIELASLFHDLGKIDAKGEKHPKFSKIRTEKILKNVDMPKEDKETILKIVRHHYWNKIASDTPKKMKKYAKIFSLEDLNLLKILTESDVKARTSKDNPRILNELSSNYKNQKKIIQKYTLSGKEHHLSFLEDNNYRATLAQHMQVAPKKLRSVVGVNELKFLLENKFKSENFLPGLNDINVKNGNFRTNMHIHTVNSDGDFTAQKLLDDARNYSKKIGKKVYFATTDHNDIKANRQILELLSKDPKKYKNIRFIPGIEIRNNHIDENGKAVYYETLVYGLNPYKKGYETLLPHQKTSIKSHEMAEFFKDEDVLMSLAHPQRVNCDNLKNFIGDVFIPNNGKALEANYSYSEAAIEEWAKDFNFKPDETAISEVEILAEEFQLLISGGRDCHGSNFFHRR